MLPCQPDFDFRLPLRETSPETSRLNPLHHDMATGLLLALILIAWGAQAAVAARLARADEPSRLFWARAALPLALAGAMLAVLVLGSNPDAALVSGLAPFWGRIPGRLILLSLAALLLADLLLLVAGTRLEAAGWWTVAGFGLAHLAAASFAAELLRIGEGPASTLALATAGAACRLLVGLAAGELLLPSGASRPVAALAAGLALPVSFALLHRAAQRPARQGHLAHPHGRRPALPGRPLAAGRLRRPALGAAVLLAGLYFGQAADLSAELAARPLPPPRADRRGRAVPGPAVDRRGRRRDSWRSDRDSCHGGCDSSRGGCDSCHGACDCCHGVRDSSHTVRDYCHAVRDYCRGVCDFGHAVRDCCHGGHDYCHGDRDYSHDGCDSCHGGCDNLSQ